MTACPCCQRREPRQGLTCDACRSRLTTWLTEIPQLYADLEQRDDALPGPGVGGRVTGSREAPIPIRVDPVDLTSTARVRCLTPEGERWTEDQIGHLSVAWRLEAWARDWRIHRTRGEGLPTPTVPNLATWLNNRLDWATSEHPEVGAFHDDLRQLRTALRGQLGLFDIPDYKHGVPCRRCNALTLVRRNGSDWVECDGCGELLSPEEYERWTGLVSAAVKREEPAA